MSILQLGPVSGKGGILNFIYHLYLVLILM